MEHQSSDASPTFSQYLLIFGATVLLWLLLAGSLESQELVAAVVSAILVTAVAGKRLTVFSGIRMSPLAPVQVVLYLLTFLVALIRANLDMARRVLSPSLPIQPAVVEVKTGLRSSLGRLLLANSITLTPGTLTVDVRDDRLLVHWVDCAPGQDLEEATADIAESFERHIRGFLK